MRQLEELIELFWTTPGLQTGQREQLRAFPAFLTDTYGPVTLHVDPSRGRSPPDLQSDSAPTWAAG